MQYEVVIMDLMSRIIKLEKEVEELKKERSASAIECDDRAKAPVFASDVIMTDASSLTGDDGVGRVKMTEEMMRICFDAAERLYRTKCVGRSIGGAVSDLADEIVSEYGMNHSTAVIYIYVVLALLEGAVFKRAISSTALKMYMDMIFKKYGIKGLERAIKATRAHVKYRRQCGHKVDSIEEICDEYERKYIIK